MEEFNSIFEDCTSLGTKIPKEDYLQNGKHIIIDQGKNFIAGYTNMEEGLFYNVPAIVFGDHTRVIKYVDTPFFLGADGVKLLKAKIAKVNYKYLYYALKNVRIPDTGYNRHFKWLKQAKINFPILEIQDKIVMILDKISLIIKDRKDEISLLDEIIKARFVEMFGNPEINSMKWNEQPLSEKLDVLGGYAFKSEQFDEEQGIPVLRIGNVNAGYFKSVNMVYWKEDESLERYAIYPGDLVMSLTGTVGKDDYGNVCILGSDYEKYYLNQRNAKLEIKNGLDKVYLSQLLKFEGIKKKLTGISRGVRQANIANKDILNLVVPIPPTELQNQFAEFVKQVDKSKIAVQKALDEAQTLFDSLMQEYFG